MFECAVTIFAVWQASNKHECWSKKANILIIVVSPKEKGVCFVFMFN